MTGNMKNALRELNRYYAKAIGKPRRVKPSAPVDHRAMAAQWEASAARHEAAGNVRAAEIARKGAAMHRSKLEAP